jgi:hypothetical protein
VAIHADSAAAIIIFFIFLFPISTLNCTQARVVHP